MKWLQHLPEQSRAVLRTTAYGLSAGTATVAYQLAMNWLYRGTYVRWAAQSKQMLVFGSLGLILSTSLTVGFLLTRFCPEASGSGIPQLKVAYWKDFGFVRWRVVWVKFIAGVLSIGGGCSLGREGPAVQLGGGVASNVAGFLGEPKQHRRPAAVAGAAAALAAAFNTPLAAITFALEEIITDMNSRVLGGVLLASVLGAFVVHGLIGQQPSFTLGRVDVTGWHGYLLIPIVAAVASVVGVWFQQATLSLRGRRKQFERVPAWIRPALGGLITWALGVGVFLGTGHLGVFSLGYDDLSTALANGIGWKLAAILLVAKFFATVACYGLGGCGGIFSPNLFLGGMCGVALAGTAGMALSLTPSENVLLAVVGMSACLGAVVRAPLTSVLIVFEMTHEFALVPALMLSALVSQAISRRLSRHNFYDALLQQDGHNLDAVIPPRDLQSWQHLPVSTITNFQPVVARDLQPESLKALLKAHPYRHFPVVLENKVAGILERDEAQAAVAGARPPQLAPVPHCLTGQTIGDLQSRLIDSPTGLVVVLDRPQGTLLGLVTLHDLLRAQMALTQGGRE